MTPSWYDVLDVAPDASTEEIRAAWRASVADLDPTDRRFAVLNRAAKVLLDPDARAAHDAELAEQADAEDDPEDEPGSAEAAPVVPVPVAEKAPATRAPAKKTTAKKTTAKKTTAKKTTAKKAPAEKATAKEAPTAKADGPSLAKDSDTAPDAPAEHPAQPARDGRSPLWVALVAGLAAVLLAIVTVAALVGSTSTAQLDEDVTDAQAAAEQAIEPVLSYDATDLEAGRSTALSYMTEDFGKDYAEIFDGLIEGNAQEIGAQVQATLLASAVVRTDPEVDRVQVLVFVDQQTTNDQLATPRTDSNQVTVTMQRVGDEWLVDDLDTGTAG
ncbi:DnaJ domain-containing protein [uncultured Nocardioides sp.]|uniref:J domain-containing protein n=1 Tax=uncultured Nocardioides sp. TaxID=198441 RepID=UPI0026242034|nr:DnaJ domain-containing protein [uncultured Nocardioides sp.]